MNVKIKELAEQAGIVVWGDAVYMYDPNDPKDTLDSTVMAKFAELIIRKCADIVSSSSLPDTYSEPCLLVIADEIKEHFGIEEND
jgi:hypothetical protein